MLASCGISLCRADTTPNPPLFIAPRLHVLGDGFAARKLLLSRWCGQLGPCVFLDGGPGNCAPGRGLDGCPHAHSGLTTVTYFYAGALIHHDSLGRADWLTQRFSQVPGEIDFIPLPEH